MIPQPIRAVYEGGHLILLEEADLIEGQQVQIMILSDGDKIRVALGDLLVGMTVAADESLDEGLLLSEIAADFEGKPPLSQAILEERYHGS